ncbi:uncharacterized protein E0L32_000891 [Thyridium curvatum]|uniref:VOC domain-containing protein n=1 Tax=Thyridium curvatum TaxID=1093900 RepID=A0A507B1Y5_9PEZI|nr:uncharacterized protein E0L32_000891 [Thyridium curvatum]TPX12714.1 hypothetical protein E0L32_000891 [Thyridium curvatum]
MRVAFMSTGQGTGLELFEFEDPKPAPEQKYNFARDFNRGGFFHLGVTTPNVDDLCEKLVKYGGKRVGPTMPAFQYKTCCVEDPWGNILEIMDFTFDQYMAEFSAAQFDLTKQAEASSSEGA